MQPTRFLSHGSPMLPLMKAPAGDFLAGLGPWIAERFGMLCAAGLPCRTDPERGLDHGAWVPLLMAWPNADIPVAQISLQRGLGPAHHAQIGAALRPLRDENVLIIGSGSWTHDLRRGRIPDGGAFVAPVRRPGCRGPDAHAENLHRSTT